MFDFQKLEVYKKALSLHKSITDDILSKIDSRVLKYQLNRASISITLNIAEGTSRFSKADRRNFYIIARGSLFECIAIMDILLLEEYIDQTLYNFYYESYQELSKMLFGLIKNLQ